VTASTTEKLGVALALQRAVGDALVLHHDDRLGLERGERLVVGVARLGRRPLVAHLQQVLELRDVELRVERGLLDDLHQSRHRG
jgi:hypothetical protein